MTGPAVGVECADRAVADHAAARRRSRPTRSCRAGRAAAPTGGRRASAPSCAGSPTGRPVRSASNELSSAPRCRASSRRSAKSERPPVDRRCSVDPHPGAGGVDQEDLRAGQPGGLHQLRADRVERATQGAGVRDVRGGGRERGEPPALHADVGHVPEGDDGEPPPVRGVHRRAWCSSSRSRGDPGAVHRSSRRGRVGPAERRRVRRTAQAVPSRSASGVPRSAHPAALTWRHRPCSSSSATPSGGRGERGSEDVRTDRRRGVGSRPGPSAAPPSDPPRRPGRASTAGRSSIARVPTRGNSCPADRATRNVGAWLRAMRAS